ncbi:hypothetical protein PVAP13_8NG258500 [Panicum virgatum]|uniref:Uncharacterized protein n=1 Tax=Panicum virgatum TaxID=38727 RepID=A0A8T0P5P7_PANVG|nr:hypothetical protein PVAP13_8NG258500 [Panicum virgatum]
MVLVVQGVVTRRIEVRVPFNEREWRRSARGSVKSAPAPRCLSPSACARPAARHQGFGSGPARRSTLDSLAAVAPVIRGVLWGWRPVLTGKSMSGLSSHRWPLRFPAVGMPAAGLRMPRTSRAARRALNPSRHSKHVVSDTMRRH